MKNILNTPGQFQWKRLKHGISQAAIAGPSGVSQQSVSHYETRQRRLSEPARERLWGALDHLIQKGQAMEAAESIGHELVRGLIDVA